MTTAIATPFATIFPGATNKFQPTLGGVAVGAFKLPADVDYFFTLTLDNVVVGSIYRITRASNGAQLASGIASATQVVLPGLPAYGTSMLMNITVRKASAAPYYRIFDTSTFSAKAGAGAYILQQLDE